MSRKVRLVAGIDENGYGPQMGPLVATAVGMEVEGEASLRLGARKGAFGGLAVDDSKRVFRGGTKSRGEAVALSLLRSVGARVDTFPSLLESVLVGGARRLIERCRGDPAFCFGRMGLPVWGEEPDEGCAAFRRMHVRFVKLALACPGRFNALLERFGSKAMVDLLLFSELWEALPEGEWRVYCGKVGSTSHYKSALEALGWEVREVLAEGAAESAYVVEREGRRLLVKFVRDADAELVPVALASIVGKYVRELSMLSICRSLEEMLGEGVEPVSGYRDEHTAALVAKLTACRHRLRLPLECLLRAK